MSDSNDGSEGGFGDKLKAVAVGGGAGFLVGGPLGAFAGATTGGIVEEYLSTTGVDRDELSPHHRATLTAVETLENSHHVDYSTRIRVAHVADEASEIGLNAERGTGSGIAPDIDGRPDILLNDIPNLPKLTVEVEDEVGLTGDRQHVVEQMNDYATRGRKLILAIPESDLDALHNFLDDREDDIEGKFHTVFVSEIDTLLEPTDGVHRV